MMQTGCGAVVNSNPIIVLKFGGTSMADADHVRQVADIVLRKKSSGHRVVVVVSARARQTDGFIDEARSFTPNPSPREMDMLLSSGERISAALLCIALNAMGCPALALSGSQAGIITDDNHTNARIIEIRPFRVHQALDEDFVPIVGGFQGVSFKKEITTLGRGGSDVTAVALASALDADTCEIYSDVDGVFTADPRIVENAAVWRRYPIRRCRKWERRAREFSIRVPWNSPKSKRRSSTPNARWSLIAPAHLFATSRGG